MAFSPASLRIITGSGRSNTGTGPAQVWRAKRFFALRRSSEALGERG